MRKWILLSLGFLFYVSAFAQTSNDDCSSAIILNDLEDYCSDVGEFTNSGATDSDIPLPSCFANTNEVDADVWFTFRARANSVNISVRGETEFNGGGTIQRPQFALYEGQCEDLVERDCRDDSFGSNAVSAIITDLTIGQTYFIRIDGEAARRGNFQLCVNNFNQVSSPRSDCGDAVLLCDKSSISIPFVDGRGFREEVSTSSSSCTTGTCNPEESNSVWYKWICKEAGSLEFTISPDNQDDDLDFVLYELPNGVNNCNDKRELRCMFSGANTDIDFFGRVTLRPFEEWQACTGDTGLAANDNDVGELCGCQDGNNNFVDAIDMEVGKAYALVVMNFSGSGAGFSIEFGGTGSFQGPQADFEVDASILIDESDQIICVNEVIEIIDSSSTDIGRIIDWQWAFGLGANPNSRTGDGPHQISYSTAGEKSIALTVEVDAGCVVTEVVDLIVVEPPSLTAFDFSLPDCGGGMNGSIELTTSGGSVPYRFEWNGSGMFNLGENSRENLSEGIYTVIVKDAQNCTSEPLEIILPEDSIQLNESIVPVIEPSCAGFDDGILLVSPIKGNAPYEFDYGAGFVGDSTLQNITAGEYTINVRDANGCNSTFSIIVGQPDSLELEVTPTNISCKGLVDGLIQSIVGGGVGDYSYLWNTGASTESIEELAEGEYSLTVQDANGCEIIEIANIIEPDGIDFDIADVIDSGCPGIPGGSIIVNTIGGTPPYEFGIVDLGVQSDSVFNQLLAGTYQIFVEDSRGCLGDTLEAEVSEPPAFFVDAGEDQTINLGFEADLEAVVFPFGKIVDFQWEKADSSGLSCEDCPNPTASPFNTTEYTITIMDESGCISTDVVTVIVNKERPIYIPTAFAPESRNTGNRNFTLFGGQASRAIRNLKIFTRWGDLVFETSDIPVGAVEEGWDGTFNGEIMNSGVYVFYAEVEFIDGVVVDYEGDVTLLR